MTYGIYISPTPEGPWELVETVDGDEERARDEAVNRKLSMPVGSPGMAGYTGPHGAGEEPVSPILPGDPLLQTITPV